MKRRNWIFVAMLFAATSLGTSLATFTRLHDADVLTFIYGPGSEFEPVYEAIPGSFQVR